MAVCEFWWRLPILWAGRCVLSLRDRDELGHVREWKQRVHRQALLCGGLHDVSATFSSALGAAISGDTAIPVASSPLTTSS